MDECLQFFGILETNEHLPSQRNITQQVIFKNQPVITCELTSVWFSMELQFAVLRNKKCSSSRIGHKPLNISYYYKQIVQVESLVT